MIVTSISQGSERAAKWSRRSLMTCATLTSPQLCSSFKLVLTFERATFSVSAISSAGTGPGAR